MKKMIQLAVLNEEFEIYLVVDMSYLATGAILFQMNDKEERFILGLFSRKRVDLKNRKPLSKCSLELAGIASALAHF